MTDYTPQIGDEWYRYWPPQMPPDAEWPFKSNEPDVPLASLETFYVHAITPCGVWLVSDYEWNTSIRAGEEPNHRRWVSLTARKRYAYPTKRLARESYRIRMRHFLGHARTTFDRAQWLQLESKFEGIDYEVKNWEITPL